MKNILKILFTTNFIVLPSMNLMACAFSIGNNEAKLNFLEKISKLFNLNIFNNEEEIIKEIDKIKTTIELEYNIVIYDEMKEGSRLNEKDFYFDLKFEDTFFEINKKQVIINIFTVKSVNNEFVWNKEMQWNNKEIVTFNLNSYGLSLESKDIIDSTLVLPNDNLEKEVQINGFIDPKKLYFELFKKDETIAVFNGYESQGEWQFALKNNGLMTFKGFNNSISSDYKMLRIIEETNEGYLWADLSLEGSSSATKALDIQLNENESINIEQSNIEQYLIGNSGKLVLDMKFIDNKTDDFKIIWNDNNLFNEIEKINENHWRLTIENQVVSSRTIIVIPNSLENRTEKIFLKFNQEI